jgi:hypothetical protein
VRTDAAIRPRAPDRNAHRARLLLPPATVEDVEKQATLEDVFLGRRGAGGTDVGAGNHHGVGSRA